MVQVNNLDQLQGINGKYQTIKPLYIHINHMQRIYLIHFSNLLKRI